MAASDYAKSVHPAQGPGRSMERAHVHSLRPPPPVTMTPSTPLQAPKSSFPPPPRARDGRTRTFARIRRSWRRVSRSIALASRGFVKDEGLHRASALSFDTVLAIVPLMALTMAVLKGLGAYERLDQGLIRPWLTHTFGGGALSHDAPEHIATLRDAFVHLLDFVNHAEVSSLGVVGLLALLYIIVAVLSSTETALDAIFAVAKPRSIAHRAVNYAALLFIMPICIVLATALTSTVERYAEWHTAIDILLDIGSIAVVGLGLMCLYLLMPNTGVTIGSAALGAMIGAVLGYAAFVAQVHVQLGVARYNLLYSSVAAFPLFLLWIFFSWLAVLFGAEVAAAHYDRVAFRWKLAGHRASFAQQERLALRIMTYVADAYLRALPPPTLNTLVARCEAPTHLIQNVLDSLVAHRIVAPVAVDKSPGYLPARDIATVSTSELLQALRQGAPQETLTTSTWTSRADDRAVKDILNGLTGTMRESAADCSVQELVERVRRAEEASQARRLQDMRDGDGD